MMTSLCCRSSLGHGVFRPSLCWLVGDDDDNAGSLPFLITGRPSHSVADAVLLAVVSPTIPLSLVSVPVSFCLLSLLFFTHQLLRYSPVQGNQTIVIDDVPADFGPGIPDGGEHGANGCGSNRNRN